MEFNRLHRLLDLDYDSIAADAVMKVIAERASKNSEQKSTVTVSEKQPVSERKSQKADASDSNEG